MKRTKVKSSNVASVGYDVNGKKLEVEFKDGAVYQYLEVSAEVHSRLRRSKSPGKFIHTYVKGAYESEKV